MFLSVLNQWSIESLGSNFSTLELSPLNKPDQGLNCAGVQSWSDITFYRILCWKLFAHIVHWILQNWRKCGSVPSNFNITDFPKLAEKLSVIRTDRHENLVRPKNILPVRKKSPKKFTVTCIMFSLAFLEWFTLVLAIGHLISPLVFIEVKVIQFSVFSVVQNCICYVFYSVCLEFCCFDDLVL